MNKNRSKRIKKGERKREREREREKEERIFKKSRGLMF
jgi:hypothetical protein